MNNFWRITAILGLTVLIAQTTILAVILRRMPTPLVTLGDYKAARTDAARSLLNDKRPIARATVAIDDDTPIPVKIDDQLTTLDVRIVR